MQKPVTHMTYNLSQRVIDKYLRRVQHARDSGWAKDKEDAYRDWIGVIKGKLGPRDLARVLLYIYTTIDPQQDVVEVLIRDTPDDVWIVRDTVG